MPSTARIVGKNDEPGFTEALNAWPMVKSVLFVPRNEAEYDRLVDICDQVMAAGGSNEEHPLADLADVLIELIGNYEKKHLPARLLFKTGTKALQELMEHHGLTQSDLPEIGGQSLVSQILAGKRRLTVQHIQRLSQRFEVSPVLFMD